MQTTYFTSPRGIAIRPRLNKPDTRNNPLGLYHTRLKLRAEDAAPYVAAINEAMQHSLATAQQNARNAQAAARVKPAKPPYTVEADGSVLLTLKMKAKAADENGRPRKAAPKLYNVAGVPDQRLFITEGSTVKAIFAIGEWYSGLAGAGATLRLKAVQMIEPAAPREPDDSAYRFEEQTEAAMATA